MSAGSSANTLFAVSQPIDWSLSMTQGSISLLNSLSNTSSSSPSSSPSSLGISLQTSISRPTSMPASLMLQPPLPIPFLTSSGSMNTLILSFSSVPMSMEEIFAGLSALWMRSWVLLVHWRTSMFSFLSSRTMPMILEPFTPIQAPIGSILSS